MSTASTFRLSPQQACLFARPGTALTAQCAVIVAAADPAALRALVAQHEILRSTFPTPPGARAPLGQTVHDQLDAVWETLPAGELDLDSLLSSETTALTTASDGSPLRVAHQDRGDGSHLLILTALAAAADLDSLLQIAAAISGQGEAVEEPLQHADYAEWRLELLEGDDPEATRGRALWATLDERDPPPAFPLPPAASGDALVQTPLALDREQLKRSSEALGASAELILMAAWAALLARILNSDEVLLATLADGRALPDLAGAIGPYSQAVPVPARIGPQTSFAEVVDQLRRASGEATRLQDYGSEQALTTLLDRATAGFAALPVSTPGLLAARSAVPSSRLGLAYTGESAGLWADPALTDADGLQSLASWLETLVGAIAAAPDARVADLEILSPDARAALLAQGTGAAPGPETVPVHVAFAAQVAARPDSIAVVAADATLTYAELNARAEQLAGELTAAGAQAGVPIGVCLPRSAELLAAVLAILKTGAPYLPLNPGHPPERRALQLTEAGAGHVIDADGVQTHVATPVAPRAGEPLAYVMYTSGSTGTPKGVGVTHANLAAYTAAISGRLGVEAGTSFAVVSELSTDLGNTCIFPPLTSGGSVHLIDPDTAMDGAALSARPSVDVLKITPTHLRALLPAGAGVLPAKWLILGGEALPWELVDAIRATGSQCRILNHYGPTETTVGCCTLELDADAEVLRNLTGSVPIGRPLAGYRVFVLDAASAPQPLGIAGELCIAGTGVTAGYLNRPEETAERFVPAADGDGTMYRTGDRARLLPGGAVEFLGRLDNQVKIRGFRVEPEEIEARLRTHAGVRETAVVARPMPPDGDLSLVAYVAGSPAPDAAELKAFLAQTLPEHMVPARFVEIEALPLTASGKVDRRALPDPGEAEAQRSAEFVAPRDDLEREIAAIWCDLLGIPEVGVTDDFFALGGHSLLATQAIMRVRQRYGSIPLAAMFNAPTVSALAEAIRAREADAAS